MSNYKDELVDIYASYDKLSEAEKSLEYQKLCKQHDEKNSPFHKFRKDIAEIKGVIEEKIDQKQLSEKGQISVSLMLIQTVLNNLKNKKEEDILNYCRKLIINAYSKNWGPEQLRYFEDVYEKLITTEYDYFLSFTRRNPSPDEYNIVNKNYKYFIKDTLGRHSFKEEVIKKNLLAKSINQILRDSGYNGFFYPDDIGDNQLVDPKVERACKNSFIFIQVIQNIMFIKPDVENYCFKEYNYVIGSFSEAQIIFVLAEGSYENLCKWRDACFDYLKWHKHVSGKNSVILRFTTTSKEKEEEIESIKKEIEKRICKKIEEHKDRLFENVP
jgi:ribosomal protein L29